jgi:hypothetical protein
MGGDGFIEVKKGKKEYTVRFNAAPYVPSQSGGGKGGGKGKSKGKNKSGGSSPTAQNNNKQNRQRNNSCTNKSRGQNGQRPWVPCTNVRCKGHQGSMSFKYLDTMGQGQNGLYCMGCGQKWTKSLSQALEQGMLPRHLYQEKDCSQAAEESTPVSPFAEVAGGQPLRAPEETPQRQPVGGASPFKTSVPKEILEKCPESLRITLDRHLFRGPIHQEQMQILERRAQGGEADAKAFLECVVQAKAYLDIPIMPKTAVSGAAPAQSKDKANPEHPRTLWNRLNAELNQKGRALEKNKTDMDWHASKQQHHQEESDKHKAACSELQSSRQDLQAEWKELSERAGQAKIAWDTAQAADPNHGARNPGRGANPVQAKRQGASILAKVNGCLDTEELALLRKLLLDTQPVATDRQAGNPCAAAESVPALAARFESGMGKRVHGGYPAPVRSTLQQQVDKARATDCKGLAPADGIPLVDPRFDAEEESSDSWPSTFPGLGEEEDEDIAEAATKRKGLQEGETCLQPDGTEVTGEEGSTGATAAKKARPAQSTGQTLAEELAANEEQRAGLQEKAGKDGGGSTPAHGSADAAPASAEQHSG